MLGREFGETGIGAMGWNFARRCGLAWSKLSVERRRESAGIFGEGLIVEAHWTGDSAWPGIWRDWDRSDGLEFRKEVRPSMEQIISRKA